MTRMRLCHNVPKLYRMYVEERATLTRCAQFFHTTPSVIKRWLAQYDIPLRATEPPPDSVRRNVREILDMPYAQYGDRVATVPVAILECGHKAAIRKNKRDPNAYRHIKTMRCRVCTKEQNHDGGSEPAEG